MVHYIGSSLGRFEGSIFDPSLCAHARVQACVHVCACVYACKFTCLWCGWEGRIFFLERELGEAPQKQLAN